MQFRLGLELPTWVEPIAWHNLQEERVTLREERNRDYYLFSFVGRERERERERVLLVYLPSIGFLGHLPFRVNN